MSSRACAACAPPLRLTAGARALPPRHERERLRCEPSHACRYSLAFIRTQSSKPETRNPKPETRNPKRLQSRRRALAWHGWLSFAEDAASSRAHRHQLQLIAAKRLENLWSAVAFGAWRTTVLRIATIRIHVIRYGLNPNPEP